MRRHGSARAAGCSHSTDGKSTASRSLTALASLTMLPDTMLFDRDAEGLQTAI